MAKRILFWLSIVFFALAVASSLIDYSPYVFTWDDSDYLGRSLGVSKAFWHADWTAMMEVMPSIRPPMLTLLALPWGPGAGLDAVGHCFLTLLATEAFFVGLSLYLLLRIGMKPYLLAFGALCLAASLGPYPGGSIPHIFATAFMADSLYAWTVLSAFLLIPYELRNEPSHDIRRGLLWGFVLTAGTLIKASFLCLMLCIVPLAVGLRARNRGRTSALRTLAVLLLCLIPTATYWLTYGLPALKNGWAASFGRDAVYYHVPLHEFLRFTRQNSPGMELISVVVAGFCLWIIFLRPREMRSPALAPFAILLSFCCLALYSSNREIRYFYPGLVGLPFLLAQFLSQGTPAVARRTALGASFLVSLGIVALALPMQNRVDRNSFHLCDMVLKWAEQSRAKKVLLASDSPNLNLALFVAASEIHFERPPFVLDSLACTFPPSIEEDLRKLAEFDMLVVQDARDLNPPWTNKRAQQYEDYARSLGGAVRSAEGVRMYQIPRR